MADAASHLRQARENREHAEWLLATRPSDDTVLRWAVTAAFYCAFHGMTAYLPRCQAPTPRGRYREDFVSEPRNPLTDEHYSEAERATLREWETKILQHLAVTPSTLSGVLDLHPILVKRKEDMTWYFHAINFLRDRGFIDHYNQSPPAQNAMQINEDGLAELRRRRGRG